MNSTTYINEIDIWQDKPKLAQLEISEKDWKPSVHFIGEKVVHIVAQGDESDETSDSSSDEEVKNLA